MSAFTRALLQDGGFNRPLRAGDGIVGEVVSGAITADAASVITVALMGGGLITRTGPSASRTDTSDTAVNILAANPSMDIGDSFILAYSNQSTQTVTLAGGVGVTASGNLLCVTLTCKFLVFTKTSATTMTMQAL